MFRKAFFSIAAAAVAGILASSANAAVNLQLTIVASTPGPVTDPNGTDTTATQFVGGTWQVYATLTGDTSTTLGLAGLQIDVKGGGGISIEDFNLGDGDLGTEVDLPSGSNGNISGAGFSTKQSTGNFGAAIAGYQDTSSYRKGTGSSSTLSSIFQGLGLTAGSVGSFSWANPVLVADGYYAGTSGTLSVGGATNFVTLLPNPLGATPTTGSGSSIQTISPDTVNGALGITEGFNSIPVGNPSPEPASLGVLALGGLALLARRRKTA